MTSDAARTFAISLVSHTNVGKTTLARTLLQRDIGEVRDEAHVTMEAEGHTMIETPEGDRLELWDTPGFGDSVRLARRLAQAGNPIGWFMTEVWDRFRDKPFWSSQRAVRNVLDRADVVLYLVNASEAPDDAAHLDAELQVLTLVGKPVVVLLNQLGAPRPAAEEAAQAQRWRSVFASKPIVRDVLALDAFARCWVQEQRLLQAIAAVLASEAQAAFGRLRAAWQRRAESTWEQSMRVLGEALLRAAADREALSDAGWSARIKAMGSALGLRREGEDGARAQAMRALAERLDANLREATDRLIRLHGLDGRAAREVLDRVAAHYTERAPVSEGKAAAWGGAVTGALAGLKADVLSGGLTLGGGLIAGALIGALGAAGLARGVNVVRGVERAELHWNDEALDRLTGSVVLTYLAVAHYGRGRGEWSASEHPSFWGGVVDRQLPARRALLHGLWGDAREVQPPTEPSLAKAQQAVHTLTAAVLGELYPGEATALRGGIAGT